MATLTTKLDATIDKLQTIHDEAIDEDLDTQAERLEELIDDLRATHDEYIASRYLEEWAPKDERYLKTQTEIPADLAGPKVQMLNADGDLPVTRVEHASTEPDYRTSMESRAALVPCSPLVRQHAIVLFSGADKAIRQRALDELKRLMDEDASSGAFEVLMQFEESKN
jgi:hypothetical protein